MYMPRVHVHVYTHAGIVCLDRLESILELVGGSTVQKKEGRLVVQKYIG